jgi:hypothetical protein
MEITKEELVELIKSTVTALNAKPAEAPKEEVVENACSEEKEETVENACSEEKPVENACSEEKPVENACSEEKKEEAVNETPEEKKEPEKTETPAEEEEPEEEKEEVIKLETLNHKPVNTELVPEWQNLHGKAFWDYLASHPEMR